MTGFWKVCKPDPVFRSLPEDKVISIEFGSKCYFLTVEEAKALMDDLKESIFQASLSPCPRCGGQAELIHNCLWDENDPPEDDAEYYFVRCPECYDRTWACDTPEEAFKQWNKGVEIRLASQRRTVSTSSPGGSDSSNIGSTSWRTSSTG